MKRSMVFEGVVVTLLILLTFLMLAMVMSGSPESKVSGTGGYTYTYAGPDNVLYVFSTGHIQAIDASGGQAWDFSVPDGWEVCYKWLPVQISDDGRYTITDMGPIASSFNGTLYVYLKPDQAVSGPGVLSGALLAISGDGRKLWELPMESYAVSPKWAPSDSALYGDTTIKASKDRVYVFHDYNETVLDINGAILWNVANVSDPAAIDEDGYVYCVKDRTSVPTDYLLYDPIIAHLKQPSSTIDAYYPNGTLYWENYTANWMSRQSVQDYYYSKSVEGFTLPVYHDGVIYAPMKDGVEAFNRNGTIKWMKVYGEGELKLEFPADMYQKPGWFIDQESKANLQLYCLMPFDSKGDVYLQYKSTSYVPAYQKMLLLVLGPDGNEVSRQQMSVYPYDYAKDGVGYTVDRSLAGIWYATGSNVTGLKGDTLRAYNISSGKELWSYGFEVRDPEVTVIDRANARELLSPDMAEEAIRNSGMTYADNQSMIESWDNVEIKAWNGIIYANFQAYSLEYPPILGKSRYAYAGGIYAFDNNGTLLWYKPTRQLARSMQVTPNGTIFYQMPDGKIGVTNTGLAAGFTFTAVLYLLIRFVCLGAVARAKARLNKNDNRNRIFDFILRNPGSTMYDVSRGTSVNLGTVRYHLFILGLNHKVVASGIDGKYVRYFTNSGTYSREQQLVLSLLRRDSMGKILGLLARRPGISNVEIAGEVGIPESITSRYLKELAEKGVVKNLSSGRERAYSIDDAYCRHVADAIGRLQGQ